MNPIPPDSHLLLLFPPFSFKNSRLALKKKKTDNFRRGVYK